MPQLKIIFLLIIYLSVFLIACSSRSQAVSKDLEQYVIDDADIYFVPIGPISNKYLINLADYYQNIFKLKIGMTAPLYPYRELINPDRKQLEAYLVTQRIREKFLGKLGKKSSILIGITHVDMYIAKKNWRFAFAYRYGDNIAVVSSARTQINPMGELAFIENVHPGLRKMVTKTIGLLYYQKPINTNPKSVMYFKILGLRDLDNMDEETIYGDILPSKTLINNNK